MISVYFQGKQLNITVIQVYAPTTNAEEAEAEQFCEDRQNLLELTPPKDVLFIISSVAQLWPTPRNPMNRSTPGLPVHHQLSESIQSQRNANQNHEMATSYPLG